MCLLYNRVAFEGEGYSVVSDGDSSCILALHYIDGAHLRNIGSLRARDGEVPFLPGQKGTAFDGAGTSLYLNYTPIACKCCATATAPMFAPSAAKDQATHNSCDL